MYSCRYEQKRLTVWMDVVKEILRISVSQMKVPEEEVVTGWPWNHIVYEAEGVTGSFGLT